MGDHAAIADAGESLLKLLRDALAGVVATDHVTLTSPAEIEVDTAPWLAAFLYHMLPNPDLRNVRPERVSGNTLKPPPQWLDLYYLLVPYAQKREDEHKILGRVVQALNATPVLRGSWLTGSLAGTSAEVRVIPHPLGFDETVRLWQLFSNRPYKLSAGYLLTPVAIDSSLAPFTATPVVERQLEVTQE